MKGNVRFQATPVILNHPESSLDDSTSSNNSNLDLLKALKLDEHSSPGDAPLDRTVFDDSVYNRDHFAGRTPHSKVAEAKKERRALQELMKVPVFAQNHQKEDLSLIQKDPNHNNLSKNKVEIQSNFLASTNSVRSVLNESSYHFDLMLQPVQDEDENKHPQVVSISLSKGSNGVHFDEENLVQNCLTTPSASRKIPIRKTPAPSQNFSPQEMQSTHSKVLGKELIQNGSIKKNEIPFEEVSNSSMEISSISPAHYQANFVSSMASTSSASPLASLISRPEVSKSSPIIACSPKKVVDVATSYSPPSILPAHDTFAASKKDATTSYSYSKNFVNDSQSVLISPDRVQSNPIDKRMTSDASNRQQLITESPSHYSPTWGLVKQGGVSFGRGPIFSNIAHNVASIKQGVHHVVSTVTELPVLPKVNDHPNLISSSLTTSTFSTSAELAEVNLPRPVDEADRIKPAIDWFSPRHTRKPVPLQPTQFQFPQSHHLPLNHSSTESFLEHSNSSNHVSQSTQLRQVRVDKPMIMKSEALKAAQICDVSVQVDSAMLKSNQTQEISTNISQGSNLDNSYSLEELMQSATSIMQENVTDTCSTYQQRHHLEKSARPPFDFTACNIGGTPSTINTKFMTKTNSNSQCTSASSAYSTSLSYTTIPSLHSVDDGYKRSANIMPSSLGKPVRVPLTIEKEEYIEAVWGNEDEEFIANYNYGDHSHAEEPLEDMNRDLTVNEKINQYQNLTNPDLTILTDIAIAHFTRDQQLEQDQYDDDLSIPTNSTSFFSNGMETTMTLDHSFMVKQSYPNVSESVTAPYPRLAIRSLKRDADSAFDIKELGFETSPNELMTIMLTLKNDQRNGKTIKLISKTIFLRVEPLYCQRQTENPKNSMEEYFHEDEKNSIFTVSPDVLEIPSQEEGMIFITFAPKKEGIYSGAVKITYRKKHFTLLLRGECSSQYACEKLGFANNNQLLASAEKTSAQMVPCHAFTSSHPYQSSPETLQSIPPTHSKVDRICFTSPIDNLQSNETPDMRSSADWKEVVSPGTFQNKLRFLQKKIGEISRKSKKHYFSSFSLFIECVSCSYIERHRSY